MSLATDIAWRYLRTGRHGYVSFITWISFVGLLLGVLILTVVVSAMNGFDHELKTRLLRAIPHVIIEDEDNIPAALAKDPAVTASFPYFEATAMVGRGTAVQPVSLLALNRQGIDALDEIRDHLQTGSLGALDNAGDETGYVVLGAPLAQALGLFPGDRITLTLLSTDAGRVRPVSTTFRLGGTFRLDAEPDYGLALVGLSRIPQVVLQQGGSRGVQLRLSAPLQAQSTVERFRALWPELRFSPWTERYGELFSAVRLEKSMMFVLLLLVVAVAAFNIISGQVMLIREKTPAIAILRTMGATASLVERIFLIQGVLIAFAGIVMGLIFGVWASLQIDALVASLEAVFDLRFLEGTYFVEIPVQISAVDLAVIAGLSSVISLMAAWIPARKARQVHPVQGLHGV